MSDVAEIENVVNQYFRALYECDHDALKAIFEPKARVMGYYENEYIHQSITEYLRFIKKISSPAMLGEEFNMRILSINLEGTVACCKLAYLFESLEYREFISLLKVKGEWLIVSKTFQHY